MAIGDAAVMPAGEDLHPRECVRTIYGIFTMNCKPVVSELVCALGGLPAAIHGH